MIKAVCIDVDDTLLDFDASAKMAMEFAAEEEGIRLPEDIFPVFRKINDQLWTDLERQIITIDTLFRIRWNMIFQELGVVDDGPAFETAFLRGLNTSAVCIDGAVEIMEYLHDRYIVCIASNGPYEQQVNRLNQVGIMPFIDKFFVSGKIGYAKPKKEFFDVCLTELNGIRPTEVMMIGDSLSADIKGAKDYGMQTCWYNHKRKKNESCDIADYIVNSLLEIKDIL